MNLLFSERDLKDVIPEPLATMTINRCMRYLRTCHRIARYDFSIVAPRKHFLLDELIEYITVNKNNPKTNHIGDVDNIGWVQQFIEYIPAMEEHLRTIPPNIKRANIREHHMISISKDDMKKLIVEAYELGKVSG